MTDLIREAQERLGRTVRRARLVEDRILSRTVRELGERLAHINHGLLQLMRLHEVTNRAFDRPVDDFRHVLECLIDLLGPVTLVCVEDQVYVNDIRVRFDVHHEHAVAMEKMLRRHNVGGITYFRELSTDQIRAAFSLLAGAPAPKKPRSVLQERLNEAGLQTIALHPTFRFLSEDDRIERSLSSVAAETVEAIAEVLSNMAAGRLPNPLPVRRTINNLVDVTRGKDLARIAVEADSAAPSFARHTLMVTHLGLLLGRAAGLGEPSVADLGVAAVLHDVGFAGADDEDPPSFENHTLRGLKVLLRQRGFHEARIQRLLVMLEHHLPWAQRPALFARILHIVDDYDALTRERDGGGAAWVPADALRLIAAGAGAAYDPVLVQLLANSLGAYPPGSILRLADGTTVRALSGVRSEETFAAPRCRVVRLPDGSRPGRELWVDLATGGRVVAVEGSRVIAPEEPPPPPKPKPPPPRPTFGSTNLRPPKPPKKSEA